MPSVYHGTGLDANATEQEGEVERIYRQLKTWLIECELSPGDALSEVDLARRCSSSRTPIREALNRLAQDGWLSRIRYKGYLVSPVSVRELLELYEYRKMLECFSAEKASQVASPEQFHELERMIELEQHKDADVKAIVAGNDRFHMAVAAIAGNRRVCDQLTLTLEYVHRLDKLSTHKSQGWIPHGEILSMLKSRKAQDARAAMAAHIDYARDRMLHLLAQ